MWQVFRRILVVVALMVLVGSFGGDLHGLGDSLAVFRPVILAGCLVACALVWRWRLAQGLAILVIGFTGWHLSGLLGQSGAMRVLDRPSDTVNLVLYQKNMLFRPRDRGPLIADIRSANADVVTLQEVSRANVAMLDSLRNTYPYQLLCNAHSVGAVAVLSRTPLDQQDCAEQSGFARAVLRFVAFGAGRFGASTLAMAYAQQDHARRLLRNLAPLADGATVIGGDFNMVAFGRSVAWFERATGTQRVGRLMRTYDFIGYPLGIDHVLATHGAGTLEARPQLGSDHYGVLAFIELP